MLEEVPASREGRNGSCSTEMSALLLVKRCPRRMVGDVIMSDLKGLSTSKPSSRRLLRRSRTVQWGKSVGPKPA